MDSARDFDLLGELVLQVRGLAGALALSGFSLNLFSLLSFFVYIYILVSVPTLWTQGTVWDGDLATVLDWRGLCTTGL